MAGKKKDFEKAAQEVEEKAEAKFSKEQFLASKSFHEKRDIVDALLEGGKLYTKKEVEEKIKSYMKGKVK